MGMVGCDDLRSPAILRAACCWNINRIGLSVAAVSPDSLTRDLRVLWSISIIELLRRHLFEFTVVMLRRFLGLGTNEAQTFSVGS